MPRVPTRHAFVADYRKNQRNSDWSDGSANAPPTWIGKMSKCGQRRTPRIRGIRR
jgi:hypothetical protein